MIRIITLALASALAACGGGADSGEAPPSPNSPQQALGGLYDVQMPDLNQNGSFMIGDLGTAVYSSREYVGSAGFQRSGETANATLRLMDHPIDDLNNEFPSAKDSGMSRALALTPTSTAWSGQSVVLTRRPIPAATVASLQRGWRFRNLYRFGGSTFLDYSADFDVTSTGDLTGFDTNGCVFTGQIAAGQASGLFTIRINASSCGATNSYIDNYSYEGYAYVSENPTALNVVAVNGAVRQGVAFRLSPRS